MSVQALSCAIDIRGVTASEKLLLLVLANYADDKMTCWPSHRKLAREACLSERTILTLLKALEGRLLISRRERLRDDGSRTSDAITLHFSGEVISPPGEAGDTGVGKPTTGGGAQISPLTTFEPPEEEPSEEPSLAASARPTARRSRFCPFDWFPLPGDLAVGAEEGFSPGEIERELAKFRDCEFRTPHSDWSRTFRTWLRRASEQNRRNERPHTDPKFLARQANMRAAAEGARRVVEAARARRGSGEDADPGGEDWPA